MAIELWRPPVPPTGLHRGPHFAVLLGRQCEISMEYEGSGDEMIETKLLFEECEAFKCTYMSSLSVEMIKTAYGKLVRLGSTEWLRAIGMRIDELHKFDSRFSSSGLQHLMICFDDGPCYEFICKGFTVTNEPV